MSCVARHARSNCLKKFSYTAVSTRTTQSKEKVTVRKDHCEPLRTGKTLFATDRATEPRNRRVADHGRNECGTFQEKSGRLLNVR